jgi:hypothetical protein
VIAVAELGCQHLAAAPHAEAHRISALELDRELGGLPPSKRHAYLLFLECLSGALDQIKSNPKNGRI